MNEPVLVPALGQLMTPERAAVELAQAAELTAAIEAVGASGGVQHSGYAPVIFEGEKFNLVRRGEQWLVEVGKPRHAEVLASAPTPLGAFDRVLAIFDAECVEG